VEVLRALTPPQRDAFLLWLVGFNQVESGRIIGVSQRTISYRLVAARTKARKIGGEYDGTC